MVNDPLRILRFARGRPWWPPRKTRRGPRRGPPLRFTKVPCEVPAHPTRRSPLAPVHPGLAIGLHSMTRAYETRARAPIPPQPITSLHLRSHASRRPARVLRAPTSHRRSASACRRCSDSESNVLRRHRGHIGSANQLSISVTSGDSSLKGGAPLRASAHERLASRPHVTPSPEHARAPSRALHHPSLAHSLSSV